MATVNSMKALGQQEGTDTILYSQHATKIGSHNRQGEVNYYQTSPTLACGPGYLIYLHGLIFLLFTHFHH